MTVARMMIELPFLTLTHLIDAERILDSVRLAVARALASPVPILLEIRSGGAGEQ
jgi:hypothetical protein